MPPAPSRCCHLVSLQRNECVWGLQSRSVPCCESTKHYRCLIPPVTCTAPALFHGHVHFVEVTMGGGQIYMSLVAAVIGNKQAATTVEWNSLISHIGQFNLKDESGEMHSDFPGLL